MWNNGVCEAWRAKNEDILRQRLAMRVKKEAEVVVLD
jgi:hypothetical protein